MDECYDINGIRLERHGRLVYMQNHRTKQQQDAFDRCVVKQFPMAKRKMSELVNEAIDKIVHCDPKLLLLIASLQSALHRTKHQDDEGEMRTRALEFVQNVLVTHRCVSDSEMAEDDRRMRCFDAVRAVEEMYLELRQFSFYFRYMAEQLTDEKPLAGFISDVQMFYLVRGKRDVHFHSRYFSLLLGPHDQTFRDKFGIPSALIVEGITKLADRLFYDGPMLIRKHDMILNAIEKKFRRRSARGLVALQWNWLRQEAENIEHFNVGKITGWTDCLMEALSSSLASKDEPVTHEYQFWPIDDLQIKDRPFVRIDGNYYCFDYYTFVDNIYRALFNAIRVGDETGRWSKLQTQAIESAVGDVFEHLLPGCLQLRNVLYNASGRAGDLRELDLVVLASGITFVVEDKGVYLDHASPLLNFDKVRSFYEKGLAKAGKQSRKFQDYFDSSEEIVFLNADGSEALRVKRSDMGKLCRMCVTVDGENNMTSSTMRLKDISVDAKGLVVISLDDLLVYERYFDSPMMFLAYVDYRCRQTEYEDVSSADELDHLGLFIGGRGYADGLRQLCCDGAMLSLSDYHSLLNDFFQSLSDPRVKKPELYVPIGLRRLMDQIWKLSLSDKTRLAAFLTSLDDKCKDWLADMLEREQQLQRQGDHQRLRSTFCNVSDKASGLSMLVNTQWGARLPEETWRLNLQGVMKKFEESSRYVLVLEYDPGGALADISLTKVHFEDLTADEERVEAMITEIKQRVVAHVRKEKGCPGRNDPCPCGSGLKYKRCCGR